jgi:hypothetical protein
MGRVLGRAPRVVGVPPAEALAVPSDEYLAGSTEPAPANTPDLGVTFCPACEPDRSVLDRRDDGKVWIEKACGSHDGFPKGNADDEARAAGVGDAYLPASEMADGRVSNTEACKIVHGRGGDAQA